MKILDPYTGIRQILGQILRHPLGQCGNKNLVLLVDLSPDLADKIIDLLMDTAVETDEEPAEAPKAE